MANDYDDFMNEIREKHTDNAFLLISTQVNGLKDSSGRSDLVSLKCTYELDGGEQKTIKFYMPKHEAAWLAESIAESSADSGHRSSIH